MEDKNFYEIGKERKRLRQEVLAESGLSAREFSSTAPVGHPVVTEGEFSGARLLK